MSCIQTNIVSSFVNFACILCYKVPSTKNDINFLKEDIKTELEAVPVVLAPMLKCICKPCLSMIRKRKGLREKLRELDSNIKILRQAPLSDSGSRPAVAKRLEYEATDDINSV